YAFGVFNGNNRNTQLNDDGHFMYVGRIASTPFAGKLFGQDVKWKIGADGAYSRYGAGTRISQSGNLNFNAADGSLSAFTVPAAAGSAAKSRSWAVNQRVTMHSTKCCCGRRWRSDGAFQVPHEGKPHEHAHGESLRRSGITADLVQGVHVLDRCAPAQRLEVRSGKLRRDGVPIRLSMNL